MIPSTGNIKINDKSHADDYNNGRGASCERGHASFCDPNPLTSVPGPIPIGGAAAAFISARKIRSRISR